MHCIFRSIQDTIPFNPEETPACSNCDKDNKCIPEKCCKDVTEMFQAILSCLYYHRLQTSQQQQNIFRARTLMRQEKAKTVTSSYPVPDSQLKHDCC